MIVMVIIITTRQGRSPLRFEKSRTSLAPEVARIDWPTLLAHFCPFRVRVVA
jgi:hypothetical protein